ARNAHRHQARGRRHHHHVLRARRRADSLGADLKVDPYDSYGIGTPAPTPYCSGVPSGAPDAPANERPSASVNTSAAALVNTFRPPNPLKEIFAPCFRSDGFHPRRITL